MISELIESGDFNKILGMIFAVIITVVINKAVKKCSKKLLDKYKPGSSNFRIGIIGDIRGNEIKASKVIDGCLSTFVKIGGNVMQTNVILKISDNEPVVKMVKPLLQKYNIKPIGIKFGNKQFLKEEECEGIIVVDDYEKKGDESKIFFKNVDQLIYLQGDHEDAMAKKEYDEFPRGKIHYDLNKTDYCKPVDHKNMI